MIPAGVCLANKHCSRTVEPSFFERSPSKIMRIFTLILASFLVATAALAADKPSVDARRKQLNDLLADQWEYTLRTSPEFASILGDKRYNDKLSDVSEKATLDDLGQAKKYLVSFEAIDTEGFPEQEALNKTLMVRALKQQITNSRFQNYMMPVTQFYGIHIDTPQLVPLLSFDTVKDYDDYIVRLKGVGKQFDDTIDVMRKGMAHQLMPPKILLEQAVKQTDDLADDKPDASPFAQPLQKMPKSFSAADQARIREQMLAAIDQDVLPAYRRLSKFLKDEYVAKGRTEPGLWSLPDGDVRYAARVKDSTTTNMTPEEIHQLGLREVARIEGEMLQVAQKLGFSDLKSFYASMAKNPDLHPKSRQQMLDLYRKYTDQMYTKLPQLFGRMPKAKVVIRPVEEFREKEASGAQYNQGTPDGSRPGQVVVNTGDFEHRDITNIETTAYHEGVPGHHMQISIAQELPALPPFRQQTNYTAYAEGWALYSERLGREVGFFQDPYSYYGHLQDEMLRAIRLVADTGFHYKHWTRQQVVDFFHEHSAISEVEVQSETDRYIAIPGQALGYKIGQLKILELRDRAQKALGPKFDVRAFHDEVLGAGALPMDVLEQRIDNWIASQQTAKAAK
jgi:uncharacterized protein (DUF885 family)